MGIRSHPHQGSVLIVDPIDQQLAANVITGTPPPGSAGLVVYAIEAGIVVQPTQDAADGLIGGGTQPSYGLQLGYWNGSEFVAITSIGGGVQYVSGTTQVSPTGTLALGQDSSNVVHALLTSNTGILQTALDGVAIVPYGSPPIDGLAVYVTNSVSGSSDVTVVSPLGSQPMVDSVSVAIASDQTVPISGTVAVSNFPATQAVTQSTSPWVVEDVAAEASLASIASTVSSYGSPAVPVLQVEVMNPANGSVNATIINPLDDSGNVKVAVENTVSVTGTTFNGVVTNAGTFAVQDSTAEGYLATLAGTVTSSKIAVNCTQVTSPWVVSSTITSPLDGRGYVNFDLQSWGGSPLGGSNPLPEYASGLSTFAPISAFAGSGTLTAGSNVNSTSSAGGTTVIGGNFPSFASIGFVVDSTQNGVFTVYVGSGFGGTNASYTFNIVANVAQLCTVPVNTAAMYWNLSNTSASSATYAVSGYGSVYAQALPQIQTVTATQSGSWTVAATQSGSWTVAATQSGSWTVAATQSGTWNIGTLTSITNPVTVAQATAANLNATVIGTGTFAVQAAQSGTWTVQQGSAPWSIQGDVASAGANAGNPVKIGGAFNTTQPTVTNGQIVDAQSTARGALIVATGVDTFAVNATQAGAWAVVATQFGTWTVGLSAGSNTIGKVDILGNAGATLDAAPGSAAPTNALYEGAIGYDGNLHGVRSDNTGDVQTAPLQFGDWIQSVSGALNTGSTTTTLTVNFTSGNAGVIGITVISASVTVSSVTDNLGNTWTQAATETILNTSSGTVGQLYVYYTPANIGGSTTITITCSGNPSAGSEAICAEYFGQLMTDATGIGNNHASVTALTMAGATPSSSGSPICTSFSLLYASGGGLKINNNIAGPQAANPFYNATQRFNNGNTGVFDALVVNESSGLQIFNKFTFTSGTYAFVNVAFDAFFEYQFVQIRQPNAVGVNLNQIAGATLGSLPTNPVGQPYMPVLQMGGQITLQASQVSAVVNGTTTRNQTNNLGGFNNLAILLNITSGGAATGTLKLYIEDSHDGGTTWQDLIAFNSFTFGAAATTQLFYVAGEIIPSSITTATQTNLTQGAAAAVETATAPFARQGPWGSIIRVREVVSGISGSPTGVTYTISCVAKP